MGMARVVFDFVLGWFRENVLENDWGMCIMFFFFGSR